MRRLLLCSIVALSTAACATSRSEAGSTSRVATVRVSDVAGGATTLSTTVQQRAVAATVAASVDEVWRILPAVYEELGIPVGQLNPTTYVIGNAGFKARRQLGREQLSRYFNCGRTQDRPSAETYELHIATLTQVQPAESGFSTVTTNVTATARPVNFATGSVQCSSSGVLETRLLDTVKAKAQQ